MSISDCFGYLPLGGISASISSAYGAIRKAPLSTAVKVAAVALTGLVIYNLNPNLFSLTKISIQDTPRVITNVSKGWFSTTTTQIKYIERTITKVPTPLGNALSYLTFDQIRGEESIQTLKVNLSHSTSEVIKKIPLIGWSSQRVVQEVKSSLQSFLIACALNECRPLFYRLGLFIKSKIKPKIPTPPPSASNPSSNQSAKKNRKAKGKASPASDASASKEEDFPTPLKEDKSLLLSFSKKFLMGTSVKVIRQHLFGSTVANALESGSSETYNFADFLVTKS